MTIALVDAVREVREAVARGREAFESAVAAAERFLASLEPVSPGLALFTSADEGYLFAVPLPRAPIAALSWAPAARLEPLEELAEEFERIAVAVVDKERARLLTVHLARVEHRQEFADAVPGKQATGGWFALAQTRLARRHDHAVARHMRHVAAALLQEFKERPFERLFLGGPPEALTALRHELPRPLLARLAGSISASWTQTDEELLRISLEAAEQAQREAERLDVEELLEAASTRRVVLGLADTLRALHDGRVHRLFLVSRFAAVAGTCPADGHLEPGLDRCSLCGTATEPLGDVTERVVDRAHEQGARLEIVSGDAASLLVHYGGIGAWTRY